MNKFKIGDSVKTISEVEVLKHGIISVKDYHIIGDSLYLTFGLKDHESIEFNEKDLELLESSEDIAVNKFKEELKEKIHKNSKCLNIDTEYYNGYREAVNNILKLLESEDK